MTTTEVERSSAGDLIRRTTLIGAWSVVIYTVLLCVGWFLVAGFFPVHRPSAGAEEIAAIFREHSVRIRLGMVITMWGAAFFIPFTAAMADQLRRVEGRSGPLTYMVLMGGFANAIFTFYPPLWWTINSFRPNERSADMIWMFNDVAWIQFLGALSLVMLPMSGALAIAAFSDKSPDPVFPRWSGYVAIWAFLLVVPDQLLFFFKSGIGAWNGLLPFWIPVPAFLGWILLIAWLIRHKALSEPALDERPS
jgi:hypothetical protein